MPNAANYIANRAPEAFRKDGIRFRFEAGDPREELRFVVENRVDSVIPVSFGVRDMEQLIRMLDLGVIEGPEEIPDRDELWCRTTVVLYPYRLACRLADSVEKTRGG